MVRVRFRVIILSKTVSAEANGIPNVAVPAASGQAVAELQYKLPEEQLEPAKGFHLHSAVTCSTPLPSVKLTITGPPENVLQKKISYMIQHVDFAEGHFQITLTAFGTCLFSAKVPLKGQGMPTESRPTEKLRYFVAKITPAQFAILARNQFSLGNSHFQKRHEQEPCRVLCPSLIGWQYI